MNVLAVDTAASALNIALLYDERFFESSLEFGLHHTEHLATETEVLLEKAGASAEKLDIVGCTAGPGSFTGLRIGMSFAKGFAFGLSVPLVSIPSLDLYASGRSNFDGSVFPVLDARKKRIYTASYANGERNSDFLDISPLSLLYYLPEEVSSLLTGPFAGHVYRVLTEEQGHDRKKILLDPDYDVSRGRALVKLIITRYNENGRDEDSRAPLYIRPSEAELSRTTSLGTEKGKETHE